MIHDRSSWNDAKSGLDAEESSPSPEAAVVSLASILTPSQDHKHDDDADDLQTAELLRQLTVVDDVAKDVEERLDGIISNLDLLLTSLENGPGAVELDETKEATIVT